MAQETFVALFPSPAEAEAAERDLEAAGIPAASIAVSVPGTIGPPTYATAATAEATAAAPHGASGIFDWFFASDPPIAALNRNPPHIDGSVGAALSFTTDAAAYARVAEILGRHGLVPVPAGREAAGSTEGGG